MIDQKARNSRRNKEPEMSDAKAVLGWMPKPLASRYFHHPSNCHHGYQVEYLTASASTGYCRGCGALMTPALVRALIEEQKV